ncbi:hypothetical protein MSIMFB_00919 [Mycobacterium simulans]|uniref:Uncharacterized protein n=1 Tax=Mycobacterium simulans TaxID=627089 RepID=A0A7Z7IJQ2_9MYCO|nr:hypothetical protein MSIMFB_00919 [Mycobacterium simulans]
MSYEQLFSSKNEGETSGEVEAFAFICLHLE